ncbi:unnamed protein product [Polarella glacialis]|uniref:Nucleotide-diphospho-sugar transferase domain-containing protein n=1 Tax=Polarella glacialis TaxID=89957 RepID=A0A813L332_POLGL|nr:unnamed protein product [Polarella glacialis]
MQTPEAQGGGLRVVYVTMVYGRMNRYIESWAARCRLLGVTNLVMATLDAEAYALCTEHHGQQCVRGGISALNKYTLLLIALQMGIDVMWLDFDVFLVRHPGAALAAAVSPGYDLLMGYDFESDCLCNGFFYIRSRPSTVNWLFQLLRWLYDHPFEHDQRAIGAFLNYTEKVAATPEEMPAVPRWHVFDVDSTFINFGSWLGGYEELVLVHFVDGSAFSLYGRSDSDPSIPESKLKGMRAFAEGADQEESPMDAFYRPGVAALPAEELWEVQPHLKLLLDGKRKPKPLQRQACGILPSVETASTGYGWLAEHGAKAVPPEMQ